MVGLDDRLILKIFPPFLRGQFESERISLAQLRGLLGVPIPEIVLEGERDQWPYLVITRLSGMLGTQAWPGLPEDQKERVLAQIGETIAQVQRVPVGDLARIEPGWSQFIVQQIAGCRARHQRLGLPSKFLDGLDSRLRDAELLIALDGPHVILTGEYIPENFLLSCDDGDWRLSGLIDFGDVMTGMAEYDLLGPSAFMTAGMPGRVRSLFGGFGYSSAQCDFTLKRRLMALMLLHALAILSGTSASRAGRTRPATSYSCKNCSGRIDQRRTRIRQSNHSSTISKSLLAVPHSGQTQSSGMSDHRVPGARPSSGAPAASS